jgi:hypothetical protein
MIVFDPGYRAARVRVLFRLAEHYFCPEVLAYVEWFTPFGKPQERYNRFRKIKYYERYGSRVASIVPASSIAQSCFVTPYFNKTQASERTWTSDTVLDECSEYLFNSQFSVPMLQVCDVDYEFVPA